MNTQLERAHRFRALHERGAFVIPNCWDGGSARLLQSLGFPALATSSAATAATYGRQDGQITRDEALANARLICEASPLPVSADLENGFGLTPADTARTIELAADTGLVGGSIEDTTGDAANPIFDFSLAVDRVASAAAAARALDFPFTLTARAENFLHGRPDLEDTIRRLQAFEKAGADVLYAPALPSLDAIRSVCASVMKPVNVLAGARQTHSVAELAEAGAKRISLGSGLNRAALGGFLQAARELKDSGTVGFLREAAPYADIQALMPEPGGEGTHS